MTRPGRTGQHHDTHGWQQPTANSHFPARGELPLSCPRLASRCVAFQAPSQRSTTSPLKSPDSDGLWSAREGRPSRLKPGPGTGSGLGCGLRIVLPPGTTRIAPVVRRSDASQTHTGSYHKLRARGPGGVRPGGRHRPQTHTGSYQPAASSQGLRARVAVARGKDRKGGGGGEQPRIILCSTVNHSSHVCVPRDQRRGRYLEPLIRHTFG